MLIGIPGGPASGVAPLPTKRSRLPRIRGNGQIPKPAERCEQLSCGRDSECFQVLKNGKRRALCVKVKKNDKCVLTPDDGEEEMADSNPGTTNVRPNLPDTCRERRCCEGETCVIQQRTGEEEERSPSLAVCIPVSVACSYP